MLFLTSVLFWLWVAAPASARRDNVGLNVLGGEDVADNDFDFVVNLALKRKNSNDPYFCSGSLINERWILTAAHCVDRGNPSTHTLEVSIGAKTLSKAQVVQAEKWFKHELYARFPFPTVVFNDIGLVKLQQPVTGVNNTAYAILPSANENAPRIGTTVTVAGFGIEGQGFWIKDRGVMKKADMTVQLFCINTQPYCIPAMEKTGRVCSGDSGGPMVYQGKLIGVASTGSICLTNSGHAEYTRVSAFINWINDKIKQG